MLKKLLYFGVMGIAVAASLRWRRLSSDSDGDQAPKVASVRVGNNYVFALKGGDLTRTLYKNFDFSQPGTSLDRQHSEKSLLISLTPGHSDFRWSQRNSATHHSPKCPAAPVSGVAYGPSLAVMQQFGRDRVESGHRADIVDRSKITPKRSSAGPKFRTARSP
jgi:hypothetical protein